jgi:hypothetical protein
LLSLAREINRPVFIKKDFGAELKKNDVYDFLEKRTGLGARFNCKTGCIQDIIIRYLSKEIPNDNLFSFGTKDNSCTLGDVLGKLEVEASFFDEKSFRLEEVVKIDCSKSPAEGEKPWGANVNADMQVNESSLEVIT